MGNNKTIARNTVALYLRMIIVMAVGFYTSRLVLQALGVSEYGLYGIVGGVVGFFAFLNISMTQCTQRFLNIEMAKENGALKRVFEVSLSVHLIIAVLLLLLIELIGLWFLNSYINIPDGRKLAANLVYQTSSISLIFAVLIIPFNSLIIAYERMGLFAIIGIIDAFLKLFIAAFILNSDGDRLIIYGFLMMLITVSDLLVSYLFCRQYFGIRGIRLRFDKQKIKEMLGFTSWRMVGMMANLTTNQGNVALVNMFHTVTANAAMSIGCQVNQAVVGLTSNFQTAFTPQITKSYSIGDTVFFHQLIRISTKISFFLLLMVTLPIIFNIDFLLDIWLTDVPMFASAFAILSLIEGIINAISTPLDIAILSTGKIKHYHLFYSFVYLLDIPILFLLFYESFPPYIAMAVKILVSFSVLCIRIIFMNRLIVSFVIKRYLNGIIAPIILVSIICVLLFIYLKSFYFPFSQLLATVILIIVSLFVSYVVLLQKPEREKLKIMIQSYIRY